MKLEFKTKKKNEVIDITDDVARVLDEANLESGICHVFLQHTSAALSIADLDPGTDKDMLDAFEELIPKLDYRHPHDPSHVPDHILSTLIGVDLSIPFENRKLLLGQWQRIAIFEFDGPKTRSVIVRPK